MSQFHVCLAGIIGTRRFPINIHHFSGCSEEENRKSDYSIVSSSAVMNGDSKSYSR
jgi:hypothetical protein